MVFCGFTMLLVPPYVELPRNLSNLAGHLFLYMPSSVASAPFSLKSMVAAEPSKPNPFKLLSNYSVTVLENERWGTGKGTLSTLQTLLTSLLVKF